MEQIKTRNCAECPHRGRHIYVVGALRFERELLTSFINDHMSAHWYQSDTLEEVPASDQVGANSQVLILLDVDNRSLDDLQQLFASGIWKRQTQNLIALFNVRHADRIEKEALKNGVRGFMYVDDSLDDFMAGICAISSGEIWTSRKIMSECLQESFVGRLPAVRLNHGLSDRERELLQVLSTGASNEEIAERLCISQHTVKTHLYNIFHKIGVSNRLQAVLWARERF